MSEDDRKLDLEKDILYLEGLFFLSQKVIKKNDETVKKAFQNLYQYVSMN